MLTALDTNGGVYWRILGGMGKIEAALAGRIAPGSVLCSDGTQAYLRAAKVAGAEHRTNQRSRRMPSRRLQPPPGGAKRVAWVLAG